MMLDARTATIGSQGKQINLVSHLSSAVQTPLGELNVGQRRAAFTVVVAVVVVEANVYPGSASNLKLQTKYEKEEEKVAGSEAKRGCY